MLKSSVVKAVAKAKIALADLLIDCKLIVRVEQPYQPGSKPTFTSTEYDVKVAFTQFEQSEIDGDRVRGSDYKALVFPENGLAPIQVNSHIRVPVTSVDIKPGIYETLNNVKVTAGDAVVLNQLQLRFKS